jgi:hypothetical protein
VVGSIPGTVEGQKFTWHHHVEVTILRGVVIKILPIDRMSDEHHRATGQTRACRGVDHSRSISTRAYRMPGDRISLSLQPARDLPNFPSRADCMGFSPRTGSVSVQYAHRAVGSVLDGLEWPPSLFR